jgi:hypothetical protein
VLFPHLNLASACLNLTKDSLGSEYIARWTKQFAHWYLKKYWEIDLIVKQKIIIDEVIFS